MAKISVRGATAVETIETTRGWAYTYCSDGRVLSKARDGDGKWGPYKLVARGVTQVRWEQFKGALKGIGQLR